MLAAASTSAAPFPLCASRRGPGPAVFASSAPNAVSSVPDSAAYFSAMMARCGPFERMPALAVAVSGGSDSMALLHLARAWAIARGGQVTALTVDHGLRAGAAAEAAQVGAWCRALGVEHLVLRWNPGGPAGQAEARAARYRLLTGWCRARQVLHLLTAHTQDDQAETLFFRLARGSGPEGLSGMAAVSDRDDIRLLRPLLHCPKAALAALLTGIGQAWLEDPSNRSPAYTRNRIRAELAEACAEQQSLQMQAGALADALADIRNGFFYNNVSHLTDLLSLYPEAYARLDRARFDALPEEARMRVLAALIPTLCGAFHPPRPEALRRLPAALAQGRRCTLAGLVFTPSPQQVLVTRERAALPAPLPLHGPWQGLWDGRFFIRYDGCHDGPQHGMTLRPLGSDGTAAVLEQLPNHRRLRAALRALPSLWHLETLVCAPHIPYRRKGLRNTMFDAAFLPPKPLAGSPFFSLNMKNFNPAGFHTADFRITNFSMIGETPFQER